MTAEQLARVTVLPSDRLTSWAVQYLQTAQDHRLETMLGSALDRTYSGDPAEAFFTAGKPEKRKMQMASWPCRF
jgi:hypothetical protein